MSFTADRVALSLVPLSLAVALQNFIEVDFALKLIAVAISAFLAVWACSSWLIHTIRRRRQSAGLAVAKTSSKGFVALAILALGVTCALFLLAAWFLVWFYAVNVITHVDEQTDRSEIWFRGAFEQVDRLVIGIPQQGDTKCELLPNSSPQHAASSVAYDWNSPNPQLHIADFRHPQQQGLACSPRININELTLRTKPASVEVFRPDRRTEYGLGFLFTGVVLWLASSLLVLFRTR